MATAFLGDTVDPLDVSRPELYAEHRWHEPFRHLRKEAPVHYTPDSAFGPYWSVSTYKPIVHVEALPDIYSSSWTNGGGISIVDRGADEKPMPNFIAMDRPKHTDQRRTVAPAFTPSEMVRMSSDIRQRTVEILDGLPWGERFDWVDRVSIELTTQMLAILFDFPWEDRRLLTFWSDWAGDVEVRKDPVKNAERTRHLQDMGAYFKTLWDAKSGKDPTPDLISMMLHSDAMSHMDAQEFMGNLILLIVGGNDTTRNTMSGLVYALNKFPDQRRLLEGDTAHIPNSVAEAIRWQTPLAHMRRTALADAELEGQRIRKGDKVVLWYISANRDESVFPNADNFLVTRENARRHLSFGYGIHRCVGARLAELQVTILLEEMARRRMRVNVCEEPVRVAQSFVNGYKSMLVELERY
ncbi:cytochrome P450 [Aquisediminimonas profunda]|uniref:cytochrome P450 n=1 Tax=Aquisediminimonas profunda TaxID=1550733 RepID=UPI001C626BF0|nr:cytochrome P450 [Aquisediminimonas profunda]